MTKISVRQAAELLGLDKKTIRDLVVSGEFGRAVECGKKTMYLIYKEQLEKWARIA